MSFEKEYKNQMADICFNADFEKNTVELLKSAAERKEKRVMKKPVRILAAAALIIAVVSVTAFAISSLLSARDVAEHFGESQLADSFSQQDYEIESVTDKGYTVSFLGLVKGEKFESESIKSDCSYYVVSVANEDGSPLSLADGNPLGMSVIIEGYPAWKINTWSLNTSANGMEENGVLYYLYDCENLEIFADRNVYLAVYEGFVPDLDIITMNSDGTFDFTEGYDGFKAMFRISLDPSKANPEAAEEILKEYLKDEKDNIIYSETAKAETTGAYGINYLGRKSGVELGVTEDDGYEYYVYSVKNSDGTPLTISNAPLEFHTVIKSCPVWAVNGQKLNLGNSITEKDGILYYLFECGEYDIFADREVYLLVLEKGVSYLESVELENDGTFSISNEYEGWGTIIRMELDKSNADKEKADEIISGLMPKSIYKWKPQ